MVRALFLQWTTLVVLFAGAPSAGSIFWLSTQEASSGAPEQSDWRLREAELLARIDALELELAAHLERSTRREQEWRAWVELLSSLELKNLPEPPDFLAGAIQDHSQHAEQAEIKERSLRALTDLRALLLAEEVRELDLLEVGNIESTADGAFLGPVVARLLDERGHLAGTLAADRLRLECSRTGWGVTLVFEIGMEKRAGVVTPFGPPAEEGGERGGIRRMHLAGVDPAPWISAFPELLGSALQASSEDDGLWDLLRVRQEINRLLALDRLTGSWRLVGLSGVIGSALQGVHVVELDGAGQIRRRLFADRLRISQRADHIVLELEDGVQERADRRAPFLDNRYRIYLTGSPASAWVEARLPGLAAPDRSALPGQSQPALRQ